MCATNLVPVVTMIMMIMMSMIIVMMMIVVSKSTMVIEMMAMCATDLVPVVTMIPNDCNGDEDNVVDAQHDLHESQCKQSGNGIHNIVFRQAIEPLVRLCPIFRIQRL